MDILFTKTLLWLIMVLLLEFIGSGSLRNTGSLLCPCRIYYHSCSILPMLGEEIEVDSEQENETFRWQSICSQKVCSVTIMCIRLCSVMNKLFVMSTGEKNFM